jgi:hypothetical protein
MTEVLQSYYYALERLKNGRPERVAKGTKITNDSVSLEAGRKKGTIKKSRPVFHNLIEAINVAANEQGKAKGDLKEQLSAAKAETQKYRKLWEEALSREVSLIKQLWDERKEWAAEKSALTGEKITSILSKNVKQK